MLPVLADARWTDEGLRQPATAVHDVIHARVTRSVRRRASKRMSSKSTWCGCMYCGLLLALLAALLGTTASWLLTVQADAPWRNAAAAEWLEAAQSPRAPESTSSLPSAYAVRGRSTQRLYVRTTIRASDVPQCADGAVDCSALPVGAGTREW